MKNVRLAALGFLVGLSAACTHSEADRYRQWAAEPTPGIWEVDSVWAFVLLDREGRIERTMTLRLTDVPAESCMSGDWLKVETLREEPARSSNWAGVASYELKGRVLVIGLTNNLCDNYLDIRGRLTNLGFEGTLESFHMLGSELIGKVYGQPILNDPVAEHDPARSR